MVDVGKIMRDGKILILAYDQGFEHGPTDFDERGNEDPNYILDIARKTGVYTGLVFQKGIAERYWVGQNDLPPLVLKVNGKTSFHKGEEPVSLQLTSVDKAASLGAVAVGYTIYVGSEHEEVMMQEFSRICDEAHDKGLISIMWAYPRGKHVEGRESSRDVVAYSARLGLELGADVIKLPYTGDAESFSWVVKNAGKAMVVVQGGTKKDEAGLLEEVRGLMQAGAKGMAIGRNIWQGSDPVGLSKKIAEIVYAV